MLASCSTAASKVKQLEGPIDDDLPQSSGVQQISTELMTASPPPATGKHMISSMSLLSYSVTNISHLILTHKPVLVTVLNHNCGTKA